MNPYLELQKLMSQKSRPTSGVVISVSTGTLQIRTPVGVITGSVTDATNYKVGDSVLIEAGVVKGKLKSINSVLVYNV